MGWQIWCDTAMASSLFELEVREQVVVWYTMLPNRTVIVYIHWDVGNEDRVVFSCLNKCLCILSV